MKITAWILFILSLSTLTFVLLNFESETTIKNDYFQESSVSKEEFLPPPPIRMLFFGDLMLDRGVENTIKKGVDPLEHIAGFISDGKFDLVVANLEGPFAPPMECQIKPYSFRFEPEYVSFLQSAGITAVSLSNNHTLDCFRVGLEESKRILTDAEIDFFGGFEDGAGSVLYKDISEKRIAFLGFDDTMKIQSLQSMQEAVADTAMQSDLVVVSIHWGEEYLSEPVERQKEVANALANSGADLIIGHHPHVIEPGAAVDDALVFYSLGNFVFDQLSRETQTGYAVEITTDPSSHVLEIEIHPYFIKGNQPSFLEEEERLDICARVLADIPMSNDCQFIHSL